MVRTRTWSKALGGHWRALCAVLDCTRLAAWLDHRQRRWSNCANPTCSSVDGLPAPRLVPVGHNFPWKGITLRPQALREDRILHEIHAASGDVRRTCDLFGLSIEAPPAT